jgi:aminodeoxyfutalosine deaminase
LNDEYLVAATLLDLEADGVADLARAGIEASFMDTDRKAGLLREVDEYLRHFRRSATT